MSEWRLLLRALAVRQGLRSDEVEQGGAPRSGRSSRRGIARHECPPSPDQEAYLHWVRETGCWRLHGSLLPPYQPQG